MRVHTWITAVIALSAISFHANADSSPKSVTQNFFNSAIDRFEQVYRPLLQADGEKLVIDRNWADGQVSGSTHRSIVGRKVTLKVFGGFARHPLLTEDGFVLSLCHQLGFARGGAPVSGSKTSAVGQTAYWTTLKCTRTLWSPEDNVALVANATIPAIVTEQCQKAWSSAQEIALCQRASLAAKSYIDVLASATGTLPAFETPSQTVVSETVLSFPNLQCRLDTLFAGALCNRNHGDDVSFKDETVGTCNTFQGDLLGVRPACWFKSGT